jgi:hypothetical protein
MEFVAASRFVGKALISRYDSPNDRPTGSTHITGGEDYDSAWGSKGNSSWSAKISPGQMRADWKPPRIPAAKLEPDFWSNLKPKPSDNQNPFEPLMASFAARRDQQGSPPQAQLVARGGWPAGGKYFSESGTWAMDDDAPRPVMPGRAPKYGWHHQQFVRPSPQSNF